MKKTYRSPCTEILDFRNDCDIIASSGGIDDTSSSVNLMPDVPVEDGGVI